MRKCLLAALAIALLLGGALFALPRPWHCPVTPEAAGRIRKGMTQAEVHEILGAPGDYRTRPVAPIDFGDLEVRITITTGPVRLIDNWHGDQGTIRVQYFSDWPDPPLKEKYKVITLRFVEAKPHNPGSSR